MAVPMAGTQGENGPRKACSGWSDSRPSRPTKTRRKNGNGGGRGDKRDQKTATHMACLCLRERRARWLTPILNSPAGEGRQVPIVRTAS